MNALISTPTKPEETDEYTPAANHGAIQAVLRIDIWLVGRSCLAMLLLVNRTVDDYRCHAAEEDTDADGNERETALVRYKVVRWACEDEREGCEK